MSESHREYDFDFNFGGQMWFHVPEDCDILNAQDLADQMGQACNGSDTPLAFTNQKAAMSFISFMKLARSNRGKTTYRFKAYTPGSTAELVQLLELMISQGIQHVGIRDDQGFGPTPVSIDRILQLARKHV